MNLRKLYEHLNEDSRRVLSSTAERAARDGRGSISIEFFLLELLRDRIVGPPVMKALADAGADAPGVESKLAEIVTAESRGIAGALPSFDESLAHLLRESWSLSFDEYGDSHVSPVRFFETVVRRGEAWPRLLSALPSFDRLNIAKLTMASSQASGEAESGMGGAVTSSEYPELSRYGRDMIAMAQEEGLDPVIGFQTQTKAMASILLRRKQNSVAVVGEAGVGKSACALGFIDAVAKKLDTVPSALHRTPIWSLDISKLKAGAVVRGALEERFQAIIKEADAGMILYIDDIHLMFGDQGSGGDALRSVLNDGQVRILGTCGWREWRRYIEPDPGLARRIAAVRIQEPNDKEALEVVQGIAPTLADYHNVEFGENVLESCVSLARRYITGRQLPDKAIVVLDSACARSRIQSDVKKTEAEKPTAKVAKVMVDEDAVGAIVSDLTGVPVGSMLSNVSKMASHLEATLSERVVGQELALKQCASQARAYLAGLSDRRRPVGALMFCGPSGVGKTETALAIADVLFGGRILTINMSEYQEAHTVSGLKGAPAGYVGYGEGGVLTEGVRRTPYSVVLLDEIEKAHNDVIEMLYQVLDRGWMEDAEGVEADFSNALIILTSNAGDTVVEEAAEADPPMSVEDLNLKLTKALADHFPQAFIGRLQIVPYWPLDEETLGMIAGMRLDSLAETYEASHRCKLSFDDDVRNWLTDQVKSTAQGARFLDRVIARSIRPTLAEFILSKMGEGESPGDITLGWKDDKFFVKS